MEVYKKEGARVVTKLKLHLLCTMLKIHFTLDNALMSGQSLSLNEVANTKKDLVKLLF